MPIHDWTRVLSGTFHDFHTAWLIAIRNVLNQGLLPSSFYALAEQVAGDVGPDVLALHEGSTNGHAGGSPFGTDMHGAVAVDVQPPRVRLSLETEKELYIEKQKHLTIRHASNDRIVAMVAIVSAGNKDSEAHFEQLLSKVKAALRQGIHLLLLDLFPPTARDPQGLPSEIWEYLDGRPVPCSEDKPLTLSACNAGPVKRIYVESIAVGDRLIDMPLFLHPKWYVPVPLEATYQTAWAGMPQKYKNVLEA